MWRPRPDVDVADVEGFEMPVKVRLELGAIVGLNDKDAEGESPEDVVNEGAWPCADYTRVDLQHANTGAIVDGGGLIELLRARPQCARET